MRTRRAVLGCLSVTSVLALAASLTDWGAAASTPTEGVQLVLARHDYRAGRSITVTVLNRSRSLILRALCLELQRHDSGGWVTVTRTHGISLPCITTGGIPQPVGTRARLGLPLYDDLLPGDYRITLRYKLGLRSVWG